jgi:signal transduction histidine kinase
VKREYIKFEEMLAEVRLSIDNWTGNDQADINFDFAEVPGIMTVKSYLYSIFMNLISNSIKYRQPGVLPAIVIICRALNNKIVLVFKDNGLGIDLKRNGDIVFGLYKRFHYHVGGKGMGLFMVKTQVELLGGKITVISEVNEGCEFRIEFDQ